MAYDNDIYYTPQLQPEVLDGMSGASDDDMTDATMSSSDSDHGAEGMEEDDNLPDHRFEKRLTIQLHKKALFNLFFLLQDPYPEDREEGWN